MRQNYNTYNKQYEPSLPDFKGSEHGIYSLCPTSSQFIDNNSRLIGDNRCS